MTLGAKLRWKEHVKKKIDELNIKYRKVKWLLGRTSQRSQLSIQKKYWYTTRLLNRSRLMEYSCGVVPVTSKGYRNFRKKVLRGIVNAPWYARSSHIHRDLDTRMVTAK
jgi:hypothetical protein